MVKIILLSLMSLNALIIAYVATAEYFMSRHIREKENGVLTTEGWKELQAVGFIKYFRVCWWALTYKKRFMYFWELIQWHKTEAAYKWSKEAKKDLL